MAARLAQVAPAAEASMPRPSGHARMAPSGPRCLCAAVLYRPFPPGAPMPPSGAAGRGGEAGRGPPMVLQSEADTLLYNAVEHIRLAPAGGVLTALKAAIAVRERESRGHESLDAAMAKHVMYVAHSGGQADDARLQRPAGPASDARRREVLPGWRREEETFLALEACGLKHTRESCNELIRAYGKAGQLSAAVALFEDVRCGRRAARLQLLATSTASEAAEPDGGPGNSLAAIVGAAAAAAAAAVLMGESPEAATSMALRYLSEVEAEGHTGATPASTLASVLDACTTSRDFEGAESVLRVIDAGGHGPTIDADVSAAFSRLLAAWAGAGRVRRALRAVHAMAAERAQEFPTAYPSEAAYRALIEACVAAGDQETALGLFREATARPCLRPLRDRYANKVPPVAGADACLLVLNHPALLTPSECRVAVVAWLRDLQAALRRGSGYSLPDVQLSLYLPLECAAPLAALFEHEIASSWPLRPHVRRSGVTMYVGLLGGDIAAWLRGADLDAPLPSIARNAVGFLRDGHARLPS